MPNSTRLDKLRLKMAQQPLDSLWISQPENLLYLSGCEGLEGYILVTPRNSVIVTDFRYIEQAQRQSPGFEIFRTAGKPEDWLPRLTASYPVRCLGFESSHLSVAAFEQFRALLEPLNIKMTAQNGLVESVRIIKDREEIEKISRAARITDAVYDNLEQLLQPGISELEAAWAIEKFMRDRGSQPVPFELIVAGGPNSALPHARPSTDLIEAGRPVVIDIGSKVENYGSDLTRTVCLGRPDDEFKRVYNIVLEAQQAALAGIRPGMTAREADDLARRVITRAGYGDSFGHSLGHGIGLVTHEKPTVGPNSSDVLEEGMVFTVEPGIYISGWGGVRIEDDVVLENGKLRVISAGRKMAF